MKLIILDRDGVINHDSDDYIKNRSEWIPIAGSLNAIAKLTKANFTVVICTNQSGIGRNLYTEKELADIHDKLHENVALYGGKIEKIFYCPHHPNDNCNCRKPRTGMLQQIKDYFNCDLLAVPFVGDSLRDITAAIKMQCRPILVKTGKGLATLQKNPHLNSIEVFENLNQFVEFLLNENEYPN